MKNRIVGLLAVATLLSACSMTSNTTVTGGDSSSSQADSSMSAAADTNSSAAAQDDSSSSNPAAKANMVGVTMRGGVMYTLWSDSSIQELTEDMVLSNGTVVKKDGTVVLVGGKSQTMIDGDLVTREGALKTDDSAAMRDGQPN